MENSPPKPVGGAEINKISDITDRPIRRGDPAASIDLHRRNETS
jgi:hypothetical protein